MLPKKHSLEDNQNKSDEKNLHKKIKTDNSVTQDTALVNVEQIKNLSNSSSSQILPTANAISSLDPLSYTKNNEFTSEIFKIQIYNLPKFGFLDLKKRLKSTLGLNPHKIKHIDKTFVTYVCFRSQEDRDKALIKINGHTWKGKILEAKIAAPMADPYLQKKLQKKDDESSQELSFESLTPEETEARLKASVCPLWNIEYSQQLQMKENTIRCLLESVAKNNFVKHFFRDRSKYNGLPCELLPVVPSPVTTEYRNKNEFTIGYGLDGQKILKWMKKDSLTPQQHRTGLIRYGLYKHGCTAVGDCTSIGIAMPAAIPVVKSFTEFLRKSEWEPFQQHNGSGHWQTLTVRTFSTGDVMAMVDFQPRTLDQKAIDSVKASLKDFYMAGGGKDVHIKSLYFRLLGGKGMRDQKNLDLLLGEPHVYESLLGLRFRISPEAFFQVNTPATEKLYELIADWCNVSSSTTVLDICCGTGTIGLSMARKVKTIIGIEMSKPAIEDAKVNATINGITNTVYHCAKVEDIINKIMMPLPDTEDIVAVVDPPRAGLHKDVIRTLRKCEAVKHLVYVSCNPESAKENFVDFIRPETGRLKGCPFTMVKATPVDLFPGTKHCELVILFTREAKQPANPINEISSLENVGTDSHSCDTQSSGTHESVSQNSEITSCPNETVLQNSNDQLQNNNGPST